MYARKHEKMPDHAGENRRPVGEYSGHGHSPASRYIDLFVLQQYALFDHGHEALPPLFF